MLPKIWKKLLLAICIIAILFNITSKLVNRISLEKTISSSPEGINVRELLNIVEEEPITERATTSHYNTVEKEEIRVQDVEESTEQVLQDEIVQENRNDEQVENSAVESQEEAILEENQDTSNKGGIMDITDISDFTTLLY